MTDTPFYEAKRVINNMNQAVAGRDDNEATLVRLAEPMLFTEFGTRSDDLNFVEYLLEAYAVIPKILRSFNPNKGVKLETWGWRLMKNAVLLRLHKEQQRKRFEQNMDDMDHSLNADDPYADHALAAEPWWHDDRGYYCEPTGKGDRAMQWAAEYELLLKRLDSRDRIILESLLSGDNQTQIAEKIGVSQSRVSRLIDALKEKITPEGHKMEVI